MFINTTIKIKIISFADISYVTCFWRKKTEVIDIKIETLFANHLKIPLVTGSIILVTHIYKLLLI